MEIIVVIIKYFNISVFTKTYIKVESCKLYKVSIVARYVNVLTRYRAGVIL